MSVRLMAEGVKECLSGNDPREWVDLGHVRIINDAYLAEHPADEDEPVTEDKLKSWGWTSANGVYWGPQNPDVAICLWRSASAPLVWTFEIEGERWPLDIATCGDLGRLCAAAGVPLKEGR